jgi:hypothetical protein
LFPGVDLRKVNFSFHIAESQVKTETYEYNKEIKIIDTKKLKEQ